MDMMALASFGFAPTLQLRPQLMGGARSSTPLMLDPFGAAATPLRKFEAPAADVAAATAQGSITDGLPIEVVLLFGTIVVVAILGLAKSAGLLEQLGSMTGGDSQAIMNRDDLTAEAKEEMVNKEMERAKEEMEMTQGEKERKYFAMLAKEQAGKRGGTKANRKKK